MAATRREFSSGGVIYKREQKTENRRQRTEDRGQSIHRDSRYTAKVALIAKRRFAGGKPAERTWCLPKGKIEKGEKAIETATREIKEETGLTGKPIKPLGDITYWYVSPIDKARVFKKVRFFLFEYVNGSIKNHDYEVDDVKWVSISDALKIMTYLSEKKIMQKAIEGLCE